MKNKIRFAIVGCGRIAQRHAEHIVTQGELIAVCDTENNKAQMFAKKYNCKQYNDIDDMLRSCKGEVDAVSICTPNGLHAIHTLKSLKGEFHVLCEKPMALTVYDCGEMIKMAEQVNKRLFIVKQNRFNPPVIALIEDNALGRIYSVQLSCFWNRNNEYYDNSWKGTREMDGGSLFTQFSHFIDLLYWLIGDVKEVNAFVSNFAHENIIEFEDTGVVTLKFYNGAIGTLNYTVNSFEKNMEGSLTIFGEKGTVKIGGEYLNELEYQNIQGFKIQNLPQGNPPNNYGTYMGSMSNHDKVYKNVVDVLMSQGSIATNGFEGLKTVEIIDKIYQAALR
jgi:predicted dehydrogenase